MTLNSVSYFNLPFLFYFIVGLSLLDNLQKTERFSIFRLLGFKDILTVNREPKRQKRTEGVERHFRLFVPLHSVNFCVIAFVLEGSYL